MRPPPLRRVLLAAVLLSVLHPAARASAQATVPTGFTDQLVLGGLDQPVAIAQLPDGRTLVLEQKSAQLRLIVGDTLSSTDPVGTIDAVQTVGTEQGALGLAVDPGWPARPYVYVHCDDGSGPFIRISRYTLAGDLAFTGSGALTLDPATRYDLVNDAPDNAPNHNGGTLLFGPDGRLYDSLGDDADGCAAQDSTALQGTILRLDVSRLPAGPGAAPRALVTPPDNPYAAAADSNQRLTWAKGLRNPFRFSIDVANGSLFVADVGENTWEEIDHVSGGGANLGWPLHEGFAPYTTCADTLLAPQWPIFVYDHSQGDAVIGGALYRRPAAGAWSFPPEYEGRFFFSDYYSGSLWLLAGSGSSWSLVAGVDAQHWATGMDEVSDYLVGGDGALWYCRQAVGYAAGTGEVRRIAPTVGSVGGGPAPALALAPFPSPAAGPMTVRYRLPAAARVDLVIYDVRGRRVRTLVAGELRGAPGADVTWDGRDDGGHAAGPGLYLVRLTAGGRTLTRRAVLIR